MTLNRSALSLRFLMLGLLAVLVVVVATSISTWQLARSEIRQQERVRTLQEIARLLADNAKLVDELRQAEGIAVEGAILSSYLEMIRKDGLPRHSATKRNIDRLVDNNAVIVVLARRYLEHDGSAAFRFAAGQYFDYAASLRDRWQTVFEIFMAGGNLPAANGQRPPMFEQELRVELSGRRTTENGR